MDDAPEELTLSQRLVRLALADGKTMVDLAKEMDVSRQTVHLWNIPGHGISKKHIAGLMAIIGMDEDKVWDRREEVFDLKAQLKESQNCLYDTEEKLTEALLELKGFENGETERGMREVSMRFAELIDREESRAEEIETLKVDNAALVKRAIDAEALLEKADEH